MRAEISVLSKGDGKPQPRLLTIKIDEIESPRTSLGRAPGLNVPCCRNECVLAKFGVESRADIDRLPREIVQRQPRILTEVAHLKADENAVRRQRRQGACHSECGFARNIGTPVQPCPFEFIAQVDGSEKLA